MVAALFCRSDTPYRFLPGVDVWDEARDARLYLGPGPVVAHPPCRGWGRYAHRAKVRPGERELAVFALHLVRCLGGVLEHPVGSRLWRDCRLPRPGEFPDEFGGWSLLVNQVDWGHRALKPTLLYVCGASMADIPPMPAPGVPVTTVERMWRGEREATPLPFASWLVQLASSCLPFPKGSGVPARV